MKNSYLHYTLTSLYFFSASISECAVWLRSVVTASAVWADAAFNKYSWPSLLASGTCIITILSKLQTRELSYNYTGGVSEGKSYCIERMCLQQEASEVFLRRQVGLICFLIFYNRSVKLYAFVFSATRIYLYTGNVYQE